MGKIALALSGLQGLCWIGAHVSKVRPNLNMREPGPNGRMKTPICIFAMGSRSCAVLVRQDMLDFIGAISNQRTSASIHLLGIKDHWILVPVRFQNHEIWHFFQNENENFCLCYFMTLIWDNCRPDIFCRMYDYNSHVQIFFVLKKMEHLLTKLLRVQTLCKYHEPPEIGSS